MRSYLMEWEMFKTVMAAPEGFIFVEENEQMFIFETVVNYSRIRCEVPKGESEENIMFIERWISPNLQIRKVKFLENRPRIISITLNQEDDMG